MEQTRERG